MTEREKTHPTGNPLLLKRDDLLTLLEQSGAYISHLHELRIRLIVVLTTFFVAALFGWIMSPRVLSLFQAAVGRLIFVAPAEAFFTRMKIAALIGGLLALPVLIHQVWRFVMPGLFPEEKRAVRSILLMGGPLFVVGIIFGYVAVYPVALRFFLGFGTETLRPAIVVSRFLTFFLGTTLSFGIAFQLPTVLLIIVRLRLIQVQSLRAWRPQAIFFAFVVSALLTPADVVSQFLMAIPLIILYEGTLLAARRFEKKGTDR